MTYEKSFKEEAVRLSDEIGVKKAAEQLGIPYDTLADWRYRRKSHGSQAYVGSGHRRRRLTRRNRKSTGLTHASGLAGGFDYRIFKRSPKERRS